MKFKYFVRWQQWYDYDHLSGDWEDEFQWFKTKKEVVEFVTSIEGRWDYKNIKILEEINTREFADIELTPEQARSLEAASLSRPAKVKTRKLPSRKRKA